ncbi:transposase, partial [Dickeya dianthicola]
LYAKGMTTREIVATFREMYDADVSPTLISKVTDAVKEQVTEWQNRPLDAIYPIVYLDCIVVKVRQNGSVINKSVFLALGINTEGRKELLGMWLAIKKRNVFPTDDSVRKVIYMAIKDASKKWSMPIQNWRLAMSRFIIEFGDRLSAHL